MDCIKFLPVPTVYVVALPRDESELMRWVNLADIREISFDGVRSRVVYADGTSRFFSNQDAIAIANAMHRLAGSFGTQVLGEEPMEEN